MSADDIKLPEQKKRYVLDVLQPLLEELARLCVAQQPNDPAMAICTYLRETRSIRFPVDDEVERLREQRAPESSEEEAPPPKSVSSRRCGISGESSVRRSGIIAIAHPKTLEERESLRRSLIRALPMINFESSHLVRALPFASVDALIDEMVEERVARGSRLATVGDAATALFIVHTGRLMTSNGSELLPGDVFDALAILQATVHPTNLDAVEDSIVWKLDRETFSGIVSAAAAQDRQVCGAVLRSVPLLKSLDAESLAKLADVLRAEEYVTGETIIKEGDDGQVFYIIQSGECVASRGGHVSRLKAGDYFGELALIYNTKRQATVIAETDIVRVLAIDRDSFNRLLGPLTSLMQENARQYKQ